GKKSFGKRFLPMAKSLLVPRVGRTARVTCCSRGPNPRRVRDTKSSRGFQAGALSTFFRSAVSDTLTGTTYIGCRTGARSGFRFAQLGRCDLGAGRFDTNSPRCVRPPRAEDLRLGVHVDGIGADWRNGDSCRGVADRSAQRPCSAGPNKRERESYSYPVLS